MNTMKRAGLMAGLAALAFTGPTPGLEGIGEGPGRWIKTQMTPKMLRARKKAKRQRKARKTERLHRKH